MKGNEAIAKAALAAGCDGYFGYPITPQSEITEYMSKIMLDNGKAFIQAESEVAAVNMAYGAAAAGFNAMTASSSPGMALKQEGITYLAGAELPLVLISVSRSGPGLGGIQPGQADYFQSTKGGGNGDYNVMVYAPQTIQESADYTQKAFAIAREYRTPVIVLIDGAIGQMMEPVEIKKLETPDFNSEAWAASGNASKRGHVNRVTSLYMKPEQLEEHNIKLQAKFAKMKENLQEWEEYNTEDADTVIVAYGTSARIARNTADALRAKGEKVGVLRPITLWPFPTKAFAKLNAKRIICAEMSHGQIIDDVKKSLFDLGRIMPVSHYGRSGGMIFTPEELEAAVVKFIGGTK